MCIVICTTRQSYHVVSVIILIYGTVSRIGTVARTENFGCLFHESYGTVGSQNFHEGSKQRIRTTGEWSLRRAIYYSSYYLSEIFRKKKLFLYAYRPNRYFYVLREYYFGNDSSYVTYVRFTDKRCSLVATLYKSKASGTRNALILNDLLHVSRKLFQRYRLKCSVPTGTKIAFIDQYDIRVLYIIHLCIAKAEIFRCERNRKT